MRLAVLFLACAFIGNAQQSVTFEAMKAFRISNGRLIVTVLEQGGAIASVTIPGDAENRNPLWEPIRLAREAGDKPAFGPSMGHFLALDGFGGVSKEEQAAGFPSHGEAYRQKYEVSGSGESVTMTASLPLAMEMLSRTLKLLPGRPVMEVDTTLTNQLSFDRPVQWAEHATTGSPFLEPGATVIDMPAAKAKTRPYTEKSAGLPHRLPSAREFSWPMAPAIDGGQLNMRLTPGTPNSGDHTTQLMDPGREWAWVTVLNTHSHLLLGYVFRRQEFPWIQSWEYYPPSGKLARGLELSTQPFDVPRRQTVTENSLFGAPTYRWLPAKSSITGRFYLFYTAVPETWTKIDDVLFDGQNITVKTVSGSLKL